MNDERYAASKKIDFTLIKNVVKYKVNVKDPFENTILTDIPFDFDLWSNLDPGIGIEWLGPEFKFENLKSEYLLINKNQKIVGYKNRGKTEFGYLYERVR